MGTVRKRRRVEVTSPPPPSRPRETAAPRLEEISGSGLTCVCVGYYGLPGVRSIVFRGRRRCRVIRIGRRGHDRRLGWNLVLSCLLPADCSCGISKSLRKVGIGMFSAGLVLAEFYPRILMSSSVKWVKYITRAARGSYEIRF